jgi:AcrR family transcriptional regulator
MVVNQAVGLRSRQKQERRDNILACAKRLFEAQGIETTTMAAIAAELGVSTPTIFNYFGSRDDLLLAIILEGHERGVAANRSRPRRSHPRLYDDMAELLAEFSEYSLQIFSKSVWRYADSAAIRNPESAFVKRYSQIDRVLMETIRSVLVERPCKTRRAGGFDADMLANVIYNHWIAHYTALIKDDALTLEEHYSRLLPQIRELLDLIFDE